MNVQFKNVAWHRTDLPGNKKRKSDFRKTCWKQQEVKKDFESIIVDLASSSFTFMLGMFFMHTLSGSRSWYWPKDSDAVWLGM